jgi:hypothetical protein
VNNETDNAAKDDKPDVVGKIDVMGWTLEAAHSIYKFGRPRASGDKPTPEGVLFDAACALLTKNFDASSDAL